MRDLEYFKDFDVPKYVTSGIKESVPQKIINYIFAIVYMRHDILKKKGISMNYLQICNVSSKVFPSGTTEYTIDVSQETDNYITRHVKFLTSTDTFNGRILVVENWNEKTENVTDEDHYITMLLSEEY